MMKMKQMIRPDAPVLRRVGFGLLPEDSFFRRLRGGGEIFYVGEPLGCEGLDVFPVYEDASISSWSCDEDDTPHPAEDVDVIDPKELGITEVKWADDTCESSLKGE
jgi:hypothetical protein